MRPVVLLIVALLWGCGPGGPDKTRVDLADVPEAVMKTAREKLPDVTFTDAFRKADGVYEVRGRMKSGKIREVEVKPDGAFVEMD